MTEETIVFLGDSITQGGDWAAWFPELNTVNLGVGGDTTDDVLLRLDAVVEARPDEVMLLIGTNDLGTRQSVEHLVRNIQTMLVSLVWSALFFLAGMRIVWVVGLGGVAAVGLATAYMMVPYVARRIERFRDPSSGDTFNIDQALESFQQGGWFGRGPGEGTVKRILPESHTDFVFAVAAEEFGIVLCLVLVAVFAFIVLRTLRHAMRSDDPFARFAAAGLAIMFGLQSAINMAVNLHLMPAKGMTLPFISYGGSSMISIAYGMGMLLALTRERPRAELLASQNEFVPVGRPA